MSTRNLQTLFPDRFVKVAEESKPLLAIRLIDHVNSPRQDVYVPLCSLAEMEQVIEKSAACFSKGRAKYTLVGLRKLSTGEICALDTAALLSGGREWWNLSPAEDWESALSNLETLKIEHNPYLWRAE